ncbi:hypothetical protein [Streptomyces sp. NPDC056452]|uniref:hypothetical protein n=1 Tax=Streptomyces sp. NPDC056452 TaxID=3345821 RepID=UPI0036AA268A
MPQDHPRVPALPPRWMPIGDDPELCSVGQWWDVIRVDETIGLHAIDLLRADDEPVGPVILGEEGTTLRLCFLVPKGTAATWQEPGTVPLGQRCHLVVPPATATNPPGLHWHVPPQGPRLLTRPAALGSAIGRARRIGRRPTGEVQAR